MALEALVYVEQSREELEVLFTFLAERYDSDPAFYLGCRFAISDRTNTLAFPKLPARQTGIIRDLVPIENTHQRVTSTEWRSW